MNSSWLQIVDCEENDSEVLLTKATMRHIQMASNKSDPNSDRPFFIAMGHHRPHLPWNVPTRFYSRYGDPLQYPVAKVQHWPLQPLAYHGIPGLSRSTSTTLLRHSTPAESRIMRQSATTTGTSVW